MATVPTSSVGTDSCGVRATDTIWRPSGLDAGERRRRQRVEHDDVTGTRQHRMSVHGGRRRQTVGQRGRSANDTTVDLGHHDVAVAGVGAGAGRSGEQVARSGDEAHLRAVVGDGGLRRTAIGGHERLTVDRVLAADQHAADARPGRSGTPAAGRWPRSRAARPMPASSGEADSKATNCPLPEMTDAWAPVDDGWPSTPRHQDAPPRQDRDAWRSHR